MYGRNNEQLHVVFTSLFEGQIWRTLGIDPSLLSPGERALIVEAYSQGGILPADSITASEVEAVTKIINKGLVAADDGGLSLVIQPAPDEVSLYQASFQEAPLPVKLALNGSIPFGDLRTEDIGWISLLEKQGFARLLEDKLVLV